MGKDSRLSFRLSELLSRRIDHAIDMADGQIRDRSEFGTKAIKFYLDYIENTAAEDELILNAILSLAEHIGVQGGEIPQIKDILRERTLFPEIISSRKLPEHHPDFEKLMGLVDRINDDELYKELTTKLRDASYEDIAGLYQEYSEAFFLGKNK